MSQKRVGVLFGGWGEEREISVKTGEAIATALEKLGHHVTRILAGPGLETSLQNANIEVAFLALHGRMGEDGKVQGLLEVMGIPYTGSHVLASALAMNKGMARKIFRQHNLATAAGYTVKAKDIESVEQTHVDLGFPCVVKPANGGSSVGLSLVYTIEQLRPAVALACRHGGEALVERFVKGREVTVAVLDGEVLGSCEIASPGSTFDFATKYEGGAKYHLPPRMSETRTSCVEAMALSAYQALGCRGAARIDFICSDTANDVVLEVNTLPGMTPTSLLPKIAKAAGMTFEQLIARILASASFEGAHVLPEIDVAPMPMETRSAS